MKFSVRLWKLIGDHEHSSEFANQLRKGIDGNLYIVWCGQHEVQVDGKWVRPKFTAGVTPKGEAFWTVKKGTPVPDDRDVTAAMLYVLRKYKELKGEANVAEVQVNAEVYEDENGWITVTVIHDGVKYEVCNINGELHVERDTTTAYKDSLPIEILRSVLEHFEY